MDEKATGEDLSTKTSRVIYTLGTSNRAIDEFVSLLDAYDITGIVDVRRFPGSRRFPHFSKKSLEKTFKQKRISYYWLGEPLGGFRKGGYETYQKETAYLEGIDTLEHLAEEMRLAVICAERLPWKCHRLKIAHSLTSRGWDVIHIIDQNRTWRPGAEEG
jgi:uncharacterized protein (DUF488 family)